MLKVLFNTKKRAFFCALAAVAAVIVAGCSDNNPVTTTHFVPDNEVVPDDPPDSGSVGGLGVDRFVANPSPYTGDDKIAYSFSFDGYDFYYIHLGTLENVPMFFLAPQHFGTTAEWTYEFTTTSTHTVTMRETIERNSGRTVSEIDQRTTSSANGGRLSTEITGRFNMLGIGAEARQEAERQWSHHTSNTISTGFVETTSLTNTVEHLTSFTETNTETRTWIFSRANGDREGWYRYTLFSTVDVYLYVIKNADGELHHEFLEHVRQSTSRWRLDYCDSEAGDFTRSDTSSVFEFDISMLDNLPKPTLSFETLPPPENVFAQATSSSRIAISWDPVTNANSYQIHRSTSENGVYSLIGTSHSTSYVDTGLTPVTTYYYKVATIGNIDSTDLFSAAVSVATRPFMTPVEYIHDSPGNFTRTFDRISPARVEIYMLGAGSGGQGGSLISSTGVIGASGGGGAAAYMMFIADSPITFDITVGAGGSGGVPHQAPSGSQWQSGSLGDFGGNTTVRVGSVTFTVEGGGQAGGSGQILTAGAGGWAGSRPPNLLGWASASGGNGMDGVPPGMWVWGSRGGNAASITGMGSVSSFGGGLGGMSGGGAAGPQPNVVPGTAAAGGGGGAGYGNQDGGNGGHGRVLIVITEL
ncbi:MAG: hypothetical protein LBU70_00750 [Chitinispirillales bacterium]|jgi:hypothetical protein|nr:hypothetical protein [Chitinispirillales bacterium]